MKLADVFRQLGVAQSNGAWSCKVVFFPLH